MTPRPTSTESDQGCCKDFLICCDDFTSQLPHELEPLSDGLTLGLNRAFPALATQ